MTAALVSVVIPAYNHERFLRQCLDSVLAADYPNKEIVVIDDGSTDGTRAVAEGWAAQHGHEIPISVTSRPNRGVTRTLNELLAKAHGDYVWPVASDDYLLPQGMGILAGALDADSSINAVFGDCIVIDMTGLKVHDSALFEYRSTNRAWLTDRLAEELIVNWTVAGPVMMYRREPIVAMGGYSVDLRVEDWDFYLRLASRDWLRFLDGATVSAYRIHAGNEHRNPATQRWRGREQRRVAIRAARLYRGRPRFLLMLRVAAYTPLAMGMGPNRGTLLAGQTLRRMLRVTSRVASRFH
jgi:glycosyltransferase involved in cell wall biosynthesis